MKIIQGMKLVKDLAKKAEDLRVKIAKYCADLDCENPTYPDQKGTVAGWLQSHSDICKEISDLKLRLSKTNNATMVTIELGGKSVTKSITEWIARRMQLATLELNAWQALTDRNLKNEYTNKLTPQSPETVVRRRLYFDPVERDKKLEIYRSEPSLINGTLEIINAVTDLVD